jgi:hypothetical protein
VGIIGAARGFVGESYLRQPRDQAAVSMEQSDNCALAHRPGLGLELKSRGPATETAVETLRLRKIQHPAEVARLLESYVSRAQILPPGSYQIHKPEAVPSAMRGLVTRAVSQGKTWSCWTRGTETWLFTAEMSLPLSRKRGAPVLQVNLYGDDGALRESGTVIEDQSGKWRRCAD